MTTSTPKRSPVAAVVGSDPEEPPELYRWCNILLIDPHESPPSMCRRLPPLSKCCCLQGSASVSVFCSNLARLGDGGAFLSIEFFPTISSVVGICLSKKIYRPIRGLCARCKSHPQPASFNYSHVAHQLLFLLLPSWWLVAVGDGLGDGDLSALPHRRSSDNSGYRSSSYKGINWFLSDRSRSKSLGLLSRSMPSSEDMVGSHRSVTACCDNSSPPWWRWWWCRWWIGGEDRGAEEYPSCKDEGAGNESNGANEQSVSMRSSSTSDINKPKCPRPQVSSGTHTSPAVGARWVKSSGSSLSTKYHKIT